MAGNHHTINANFSIQLPIYNSSIFPILFLSYNLPFLSTFLPLLLSISKIALLINKIIIINHIDYHVQCLSLNYHEHQSYVWLILVEIDFICFGVENVTVDCWYIVFVWHFVCFYLFGVVTEIRAYLLYFYDAFGYC